MEGEPQELVDALADQLRRSVAVDDPGIRLVVASRHFGEEDPVRVGSVLTRQAPDEVRDHFAAQGIADWRRPGIVNGSPSLQLKDRLCVPVRCHDVLLGYLWLIDADHTLTATQVERASDVADRVGLALYRRRLLVAHDRDRMERLLRDLVSADPLAQGRAVERAADAHRIDRPALQVAVVGVDDAGDGRGADAELALTAALERWSPTDPPDAVLWLADARHGVLLRAGSSPVPAGFGDGARRVYAALAARLRTSVLVGVSGVHAGWGGAPAAYAQAQDAVHVARRTGRDGVVEWDELGAHGFLMALTRHHPPPYEGLEAVDRLVEADRGGVLLATVETYLDCAGDVQRAARSLHVHRSTLYSRLHRVGELTGLDLQDGRDRLTLHLAVTTRRLRS